MLLRWIARTLVSNALSKFIRSIFHIEDTRAGFVDASHLSDTRQQHSAETTSTFSTTSILTPTAASSASIKDQKPLEKAHNIKMMLDVLDDALSCPVCLDEFRKIPKILPTCGHSFCLPCIEHWYEFSGGVGTGILRCPVCKCKTNLRLLQGGRKGFRKSSNVSKRDNTPPPVGSLRKLLHDSPTVGSLLKLQKRMAKLTLSSSNWMIGSNKQFVSSLQTLLTCRACHFRLEDPRMLPACRHSFCTSCLQKIYKPPPANAAGDECEAATIICPVCQILYRFNFRSSTPPASPPISTLKSTLSEKQMANTHRPPPPKEKLATYLPFDYVLGCLLDAIPEKL